NPENKKTEVQFFDRRDPYAFTFWKLGPADGGGKKVEIEFRRQVTSATGRINGSLIEAISRSTGDEQLAYRFMDAYVLDFNIIKSLRRGARFSLTYEKLFQGSTFIRTGEILETSLEIGDRIETREFVALKNGGGFIGGNNYDNRPFYAPVNYIRVTSLFQAR